MVESQLFPIIWNLQKTSQKRNSQIKRSQTTIGRASRVFNRCIQRRASERRATFDTRSLQVESRSANWICLETDPSKTHHGPPPSSTHRLDSRADKLKARIHTRAAEDRQALLNISNGCLWAELRCGTCQSKSHIHQLWQTQQSQSSDIDRAVKIGYVILADAVRAIQCNGWSCQRKIQRPKSCNHERGAKCWNHLN